MCEIVPSYSVAHAKFYLRLGWTVASVGACGLLKGFDMTTVGATTTGWWYVFKVQTWSSSNFAILIVFGLSHWNFTILKY